MSNSGLVFDEDDARRSQKFRDEVILFAVERRAAERCDRGRARDAPALLVELANVRSRVSLTRAAIRSIAQSYGTSVHSLAYGARYFTVVQRFGLTCS